MPDQSWQLMQAGTHVGTLTLDHIDQPWFRCTFAGTSAWEGIRPILEAWTRSVEGAKPDHPTVESALEAVDALQLTLVPTDGSDPIDDFLIHIRGAEASFRY